MEDNELMIIMICFIGGLTLIFANSEEALEKSPIQIEKARVQIGEFDLIDTTTESFIFTCGNFAYAVPKCASVFITDITENK